MVTGWTWEYVGEHMTLPRLAALERYMKRHPPVNFLLASFLGHKPQAELVAPVDPETGEWTEETLQSFMRDFAIVGGGFG